ncbi:ecdysteroid-regulated 16 kDa protein isoform X2 [Bombyx mori]|uniref:MD-2-related lipid-recognition domain-containing protein n=1 Tax=Bombyx mori TaxID=7091 RepID=A0A8R2RA20_BOMMO|nr:ecdysteroid-regulated 16 kDa protein [Bombyx mori]
MRLNLNGIVGQRFEDLKDNIQVIPCGKKTCKLVVNTNTTVIFKFTPTEEVKELVNDVYASIEGLPIPFIGVSGVSACSNIIRVDTGEAAPCPLAPGVQYSYVNKFFIQPFYPTISMRVH